jgi:cytochrome b
MLGRFQPFSPISISTRSIPVCISGWVYTTDAFWGVAWVERVHVFFAELLLVLAALHVAGVAFTSIRHRENLVAAMLHGKKRATDADDVAGAAEQTKVSTGRKP